MTLRQILSAEEESERTNFFKLISKRLIPGNYTLLKCINLLMFSEENVDLEGYIDASKIFEDIGDKIKYSNLKLQGFSVYDDEKNRFKEDEEKFESPNQLVHLVVSYDINEVSDKDHNLSINEEKNVKTALVFSKTLNKYVIDNEIVEESLKRCDSKTSLNYPLKLKKNV